MSVNSAYPLIAEEAILDGNVRSRPTAEIPLLANQFWHVPVGEWHPSHDGRMHRTASGNAIQIADAGPVKENSLNISLNVRTYYLDLAPLEDYVAQHDRCTSAGFGMPS